MKLTVKRYAAVLSIQSILFLIDFLINAVLISFKRNNGLSLVLFIIQMICIIFSLSILLLAVFSTYAFQAGLVDLLYEKFHLNIVVFMLYFILTAVLHIWLVISQWNNFVLIWSTELLIIFSLQKILTPVYYYYYKRATLRISDPRFYEDAWKEKQSENAVNGK